jgi:hypothetical protein
VIVRRHAKINLSLRGERGINSQVSKPTTSHINNGLVGQNEVLGGLTHQKINNAIKEIRS